MITNRIGITKFKTFLIKGYFGVTPLDESLLHPIYTMINNHIIKTHGRVSAAKKAV